MVIPERFVFPLSCDRLFSINTKKTIPRFLTLHFSPQWCWRKKTEKHSSKESYLTGRSAGQDEEEEEEEEEKEVWRAELEGVGEGDGTILAGVKGHCLVV